MVYFKVFCVFSLVKGGHYLIELFRHKIFIQDKGILCFTFRVKGQGPCSWSKHTKQLTSMVLVPTPQGWTFTYNKLQKASIQAVSVELSLCCTVGCCQLTLIIPHLSSLYTATKLPTSWVFYYIYVGLPFFFSYMSMSLE